MRCVLSVVACWLLVVGGHLLIAGCWMPDVRCRVWFVVFVRCSVVGPCALFVVDCWWCWWWLRVVWLAVVCVVCCLCLGLRCGRLGVYCMQSVVRF